MMIGGHPKTDHRNYRIGPSRGRPEKNRETAPARGPDADQSSATTGELRGRRRSTAKHAATMEARIQTDGCCVIDSLLV